MKKSATWKPKKPYRELIARSQRITLRPYLRSDFEEWQKTVSNRLKKQNRFDPGKQPLKTLTKEAFHKKLKSYEEQGRKNQFFVFAVFDHRSGALLGSVDLFIINSRIRWANLGYQISNQHWGNGYASEAAYLAQKIAFTHLALHRVEAACEPANHASKKVALNSGMRFEGMRKKFLPERGGMDVLVFGMNATDFKKTPKQRAP